MENRKSRDQRKRRRAPRYTGATRPGSRTAMISLGFMLLALLAVMSMRERSVDRVSEQERAQWQAERAFMIQQREEMSREIERLDRAADELRRAMHHRANPTTAKSVAE